MTLTPEDERIRKEFAEFVLKDSLEQLKSMCWTVGLYALVIAIFLICLSLTCEAC